MDVIKINIEIVWCPDGSTFLNFWDNQNGHDITCQIDTGNKIIDDDTGKEITFADFLTKVENVVMEQDNDPLPL